MDNLTNLPPNIKLQILSMLGGDGMIHSVNNIDNTQNDKTIHKQQSKTNDNIVNNNTSSLSSDDRDTNIIVNCITSAQNNTQTSKNQSHSNKSIIDMIQKLSTTNLTTNNNNNNDKEKDKDGKFIDLVNGLDFGKLSFFNKDQLIQLETKGYFVIDNFIGGELLTAVKDECLSLYNAGNKLREAGMSRGESKWNDSSIRSDLMMWLNRDTCKDLTDGNLPKISQLLDRMDTLRAELSSACQQSPFQLADKTQSQLAIYKTGGRYIKHKDSFVGGNNRKITCIYYLNNEWKTEDAGQLRIHLSSEQIDIDPVGDRLLIFLSEYVPHEVLVSNANARIAITTWFY